MSQWLKWAGLCAAALLPSLACAGELLPVRDFARHPHVWSPRLSPDGRHVAVRVDADDQATHALVIYDVDDMSKPVMTLRMPKYQIPLGINWVSPTRLVIAKGKQQGSLDKPAFYGELLATDIDGENQDYIYGFENLGSRASTRQADKGWGFVVGAPEVANGHFYMETESWDNRGHYMLYDVDASKNVRHLIGDIGVDGMDFMIGRDGKVRFAFGENDEFEYVVYHREGSDWRRLSPAQIGVTFAPITYAADGKGIYAYYSADGGPSELVEQDEIGGERRVLAKDSFASIGDVQWTAPPQRPFATISSSGVPRVHYLAPELPEAKLHQALSLKFPGEYVNFLNFSDDGKELLFSVSSDRDPGTYYLIDTVHYKLRKLFSREPWIDPSGMAERRPLRFKASDGTELEAILTFPPGRPQTGLPMVLVPHGGPHGVQDDWFYDSDAQFLASRGYLVLQVNFRGSGGRGKNFVHAGYLNWGTRIQQDLVDGVEWAIEQHYADSKRICVYGASFGGYSAMMATIRAPGLFKCAVGYAGIYDLAMMYKKGDIRQDKPGRSYLTTVIGSDDADLDANSPDKLAGKINVPVLLVHGEADERAPFAQARAMRKALEDAHKPYEWLSKPGEGHGFFDEDNNVQFYNTLQAFLEKHIGKGA